MKIRVKVIIIPDIIPDEFQLNQHMFVDMTLNFELSSARKKNNLNVCRWHQQSISHTAENFQKPNTCIKTKEWKKELRNLS